MKKLFLLTAFVCLLSVICQAQKKYEMVIEKTDGTNIVVNTEDIIRTYFRERTGGETPHAAIDIVGTWYVYESDIAGLDGIWTFNADGTGTIEEFYHGESEGVDKMTYELTGTRLLIYLEGEEDDPLEFDINVVSENEFTWTDGHDTLTFKRQGDNGGGGGDQQAYLTCPDSNHPHMIDLGLPSGTKWACCNVDTDHPENQSPTNYGGYYAWGETETKTTYEWTTYTHCDGSSSTSHDLGSDIAGTQYDVAHEKWGGSWVMPSKTLQDELRENCSSEWMSVNGVNGRIFTGSNGGSIFLPAAGYRWNGVLSYAGSYGYYWSSTQYPSYSNDAYYLDFLSGSAYWYGNYYRINGLTVRPVSR